LLGEFDRILNRRQAFACRWRARPLARAAGRLTACGGHDAPSFAQWQCTAFPAPWRA
jgi:hypothetical protein